MAAPKREAPLKSPLVSAFNNIVNINRSATAMRSTQTSYNDFLRFMSVEVKNIEAIKLPDEKQVKKLSTLNVAATFGSAGSLLSSLANGALNIGGFLGDFFGGAGGKTATRETEEAAGKALSKGSRIRIPGVRGLPILSTALAGLDFAQGLSEGESVGKAGAGALGSAAGAAAGAAGGALAGTALAGVIGQTLIPVPGIGFVIGGAIGSFAGGYLADRAYEAATGEKKVKEETKSKLQQQEQKQKSVAAASLTVVTFPQVLDKFDAVVTQFQRAVANLDMGETATPTGYDEELSPEEAPKAPDKTTTEGTDKIQYGTGNAEFGETGNVHNSPGWVHGHFQGESEGAVVRDTTMVVKALLKQGSPVYLNPGVDLKPGKEYSDSELTKYVEGARKAHTHSGTGKSIDVFVKSGTKIPVPLTDVGPSDPNGGFGGYGRGGLAGYIQGTRTWIGHLKPGSKGGLQKQKGEIKPQGKEPSKMEDLQPNTQPQNKPQAIAVSQTKVVPTSIAKPSQNLSQMSTNQLRGLLDSKVPDSTNTAMFKAAQEARMKGQESGLTGDDLERAVMIASIRARDVESQVMAISQQPVVPQQLQQYPDYNLPQSNTMIIPMMMGGPGGGAQQRPMVVSSGGGGGGTTIMPPVPEGHVLNSLFKTMLLTNLSGT